MGSDPALHSVLKSVLATCCQAAVEEGEVGRGYHDATLHLAQGYLSEMEDLHQRRLDALRTHFQAELAVMHDSAQE